MGGNIKGPAENSQTLTDSYDNNDQYNSRIAFLFDSKQVQRISFSTLPQKIIDMSPTRAHIIPIPSQPVFALPP